MILDCLFCRLSDESLTNFPEFLRNAEAESLSNPNTLFITFVICFSESCNEWYVYIGTSLSIIVVKYDALWPLLREPAEDYSR